MYVFQRFSCCRFVPLQTRFWRAMHTFTCRLKDLSGTVSPQHGFYDLFIMPTVLDPDVCVFALVDGGRWSFTSSYTTVLLMCHSWIEYSMKSDSPSACCNQARLTEEGKLFLLIPCSLFLFNAHPQIGAKLYHHLFFPPQKSQSAGRWDQWFSSPNWMFFFLLQTAQILSWRVYFF